MIGGKRREANPLGRGQSEPDCIVPGGGGSPVGLGEGA